MLHSWQNTILIWEKIIMINSTGRQPALSMNNITLYACHFEVNLLSPLCTVEIMCYIEVDCVL